MMSWCSVVPLFLLVLLYQYGYNEVQCKSMTINTNNDDGSIQIVNTQPKPSLSSSFTGGSSSAAAPLLVLNTAKPLSTSSTGQRSSLINSDATMMASASESEPLMLSGYGKKKKGKKYKKKKSKYGKKKKSKKYKKKKKDKKSSKKKYKKKKKKKY